MPKTELRRPTRRDLLVVIGRLQGLIGHASSLYGNDRKPNGFEHGTRALKEAERAVYRSEGSGSGTRASIRHAYPVDTPK